MRVFLDGFNRLPCRVRVIQGFVTGLQYVLNVSTIQTISQSLGTNFGPRREWPLRTRGNNANKKGVLPRKTKILVHWDIRKDNWCDWDIDDQGLYVLQSGTRIYGESYHKTCYRATSSQASVWWERLLQPYAHLRQTREVNEIHAQISFPKEPNQGSLRSIIKMKRVWYMYSVLGNS